MVRPQIAKLKKTMDAAIVAVVAALTGFISARLPSPASRSLFVRLSLGLSFSLFGLGVLDATPSSWNLLLGQKEGRLTHVTLSMAYGWVLWMIATIVVFAGPCIIGSHVTSSLSWSGVFHSIVPKHWMIHVIGLIVSKIYRVILLPLCRFVFRLVRSHNNRRKQAATLPIHTSDKEKKEPIGSGRDNKLLHALRSISRPGWGIVGGLSGVLVTIVSLFTIGPVVIRIRLNEEGSGDLSILTQVISCLSAVGILLSAMLNGFGSVSLPFACFGGIFLQEIHPDVVMAADRELQKAQISLNERRREMSRDTTVGASTTLSRTLSWGTTSNASTSRKSAFSDLGEALTQRRKQLAMEIDFLETLVNELAEDVSEMRRSRDRAAEARTPAGRVQFFVGIIFSIVLLVRLSAAFISICNTATSGTRRNSDPVTMALLFMTGHELLTPDNYNTLSQFISLLLTAVLSFTQVRNFLRTLSSVNRYFSGWYRKCHHCNTRSESVHTAITTSTTIGKTGRDMELSIAFASLMTCFCLACSVMTKNMLPEEYRSSFSEALGGSEVFHVRLHVVNRVFFGSAVLSAAVLGMLLAIQRQNTYRYKRNVVETGEDRNSLVLGSSLDP